MRLKGLFFTGLASTVILVFLMLPASFVWQRIAHKVPEFEVEKLSGTLWDAKAHNARLGRLNLDSLELKIKPTQVINASLVADFILKKDDSSLSGEFRQSFESGSLDGVVGNLRVKDIISLISKYKSIFIPVVVDGNVAVDINKTNWDKNYWPNYVLGNLAVSNISLNGQEIRGAYHLSIDTEDEVIVAKLVDKSGAEVLVDADFRLHPDGNYNISGEFSASSTASNNILTMLRYVGVSGKNQKRKFSYSGVLSHITSSR